MPEVKKENQMSRKRYPKVDFRHVAYDNAWWVAYRIHYYRKQLFTGRLYMGDGFNHQRNDRVLELAHNAAEDWAVTNGYDGIRIGLQLLRL